MQHFSNNNNYKLPLFQDALDSLNISLSKMNKHLNDDARGILAAAKISYINELIEISKEPNSRCWIPAEWIPLVQQIFGCDDSHLVDCVRECSMHISIHLRASLKDKCSNSGPSLLTHMSTLIVLASTSTHSWQKDACTTQRLAGLRLPHPDQWCYG